MLQINAYQGIYYICLIWPLVAFQLVTQAGNFK